VGVRLSEVETLEYNRDNGMGITVYFGQSKGSANTSDLSVEAVRETVAAACSIARHTAKDEYSGLPDAERLAWEYPDLDLNHPWDIDAEQAIKLAIECETAAMEFDKRITNSDGASLSSHGGIHVLGNSHGFMGHYPTTRHSFSCSVIGQDGPVMQRDHWYSMARDASQLDSPVDVGITAAKRTVARLNAKQVPTQQVPVLFSPDMAMGLFGHFTRAIRGSSLYRKSSFLLDSIDTVVFPEWMHIHEEPHIKNGLGSAPYDGEGVATHPRDLIRDGVLQSYILDTYGARRLGMQTTGNAGGVHNLIVEAGEYDQDALIRQMDKGLLVTELMGQGINIVTGDYSRGAAGFWVENGEIQFPVEEITVAGNLRDMFKSIVAVGSDVDHRRNIRTGSLLIEKMTVAGE
jgi:PmbA protein